MEACRSATCTWIDAEYASTPQLARIVPVPIRVGMIRSSPRTCRWSFRDLRVYTAARNGSRKIFEISKSFPREETYSLTDQIRRAARSVHANISEAWKKRRYPASFVSKLSDADTEASEVQSWLDAAIDCGYVSRQQFDNLDDLYAHIGAQRNRMMDRPDQWCTRLTERMPNRKKK